MSDQPNQTRYEGTDPATDETAPSPVLREYPPEAAPGADEDTVPVMVPGEQTSPGHRLEVEPPD